MAEREGFHRCRVVFCDIIKDAVVLLERDQWLSVFADSMSG